VFKIRWRRLPNRHLDLRHKNLVAKASIDFCRRSSFEKERKRLNEVGAGLFNRGSLARNVELRALRHKAVLLAFDNRGQALRWLHSPSLHWFKWPRSHTTPQSPSPTFPIVSNARTAQAAAGTSTIEPESNPQKDHTIPSEARQTANAANARLSTGPRTTEGKARSTERAPTRTHRYRACHRRRGPRNFSSATKPGSSVASIARSAKSNPCTRMQRSPLHFRCIHAPSPVTHLENGECKTNPSADCLAGLPIKR
jgi:hypothetical protein